MGARATSQSSTRIRLTSTRRLRRLPHSPALRQSPWIRKRTTRTSSSPSAVPHDEVKCAREKQETQHQHEIAQKEGNALRERGKQVLLRREDAGAQFHNAPPSRSCDG